MARKEIIQQIIQRFKELGGNVSDVLGSRTNVSFLGVGDNVEPFLDRNLNTEALGVLSQSKAIDEAKGAVGFAVSDKLNDIQANNLLTNLNKMKEFYMPPAGPANIIDLGTQTGVERTITRNLDAEGLGALRADMPPPGSRGGADDIAAPFQSAEETIKNLRIQDPNLANQVKKMVDEGIITTVTNRGDIPTKRASAREFLVEALKKDTMDAGTPAFGKTNLNDIIDAQDVKYITEGGGGIGGDPILLVEKYFGPRIAEALPSGASNEEIVIFTNRVLTSVEDAAGLKPDNPKFDRMTARFVDEMAKGGRVGLKFGKAAGKAFGLAKKLANINKSVDEGTQMGYGALREYGLEAEDISRLFKEIAMDKTMVGSEKTQYFKMLNQVLKNPDQFPDGIIEIKKRLGMDFARGGLAKILEV
jgi:hypothetical protein